MNGRSLKIIDGSSNPNLTCNICDHLKITKSPTIVNTFSDGESQIVINENMRGCDVFVIQPTSPPANDHVIQLCLMLDALKRSNCWRVTAVVPYYGYARQDKKLQPRVPISAKAIADMIQCVGVNRILTMDLHSNQIQGYFNCAVDNLFSSSIFVDHIKENYDTTNLVIVSPDVGGVARAVHYSKALNTEAAIIHKSRYKPNEVSEMVLLGNVREKTVIIIDDMIDTAGTLCKAAEVLKLAGAVKIIAYASHGIFSKDAHKKIFKSCFDRVYVTDSIALTEFNSKINTISCSKLLADAISNIHKETSVSCLFK